MNKNELTKEEIRYIRVYLKHVQKWRESIYAKPDFKITVILEKLKFMLK